MAVAVAEKSAAPAAPAAPKRLAPNSLKLEEHARKQLWCKAAPGVTQDDVRSPDFFALLAGRLGRHDLITVIPDDESWEMLLCVERVTHNAVFTSVRKVSGREGLDLVAVPVGDTGEYRCEMLAGQGYCIVRNKDDHAVVRGHATQAGAINEWHRSQPRPVLS